MNLYLLGIECNGEVDNFLNLENVLYFIEIYLGFEIQYRKEDEYRIPNDTNLILLICQHYESDFPSFSAHSALSPHNPKVCQLKKNVSKFWSIITLIRLSDADDEILWECD